MYSDVITFLKDLSSANTIPGHNGHKVVYGKIADIIPIKKTIQEFAEATWKADKKHREKCLVILTNLDAPEVILKNEKKLLAKCVDFETWLKKSRIGSAFRNIWGKKGML